MHLWPIVKTLWNRLTALDRLDEYFFCRRSLIQFVNQGGSQFPESAFT